MSDHTTHHDDCSCHSSPARPVLPTVESLTPPAPHSGEGGTSGERGDAHSGCPFCAIVAGTAPATIVREWNDAIAFVPLKPVVDGHILVIPRVHVIDFSDDPIVSALTMHRAAQLSASQPGAINLITSQGRAATQSVFHLHLHLVPRKVDDGLALPWYSGKQSRKDRHV